MEVYTYMYMNCIFKHTVWMQVLFPFFSFLFLRKVTSLTRVYFTFFIEKYKGIKIHIISSSMPSLTATIFFFNFFSYLYVYIFFFRSFLLLESAGVNAIENSYSSFIPYLKKEEKNARKN